MPTQREMKTCPACGTGTLRPTGDSERIRNEETGEFGRHLKLKCDNPDCGYEGKDMVRGSS